MVSNGLNFFWRWLLWPWSLLLCSAVLLFLLMGAFWLPQLPGQLHGDSAAATRWLLSTSAEYGTLGSLLLSFGFFNVVQGSLLRLFLALLALVLFIHLADLVGIIVWFRRLQNSVDASPQPAIYKERNQPLFIPANHAIYRAQWLSATLPNTLYQSLQTHLATEFEQTLHNHRNSPGKEIVPSAIDKPAEEQTIDNQLLCIHSQGVLYFRLLYLLGLVIGVIVLWFTITVGWTIAPPSLSPGETFRYPPRDLELRYQVMDEAGQLMTPALLQVRIGRERQSTPVEQASRTRLGTVGVQVEPGPPGVLIQSSTSESILAVPGQQGRSSSIGLIFPVSGSEESILLPEEKVGIRIVRLATTEFASSNFMVEIFQGEESQPTERMRLLRDQVQSIPLENSENPELEVLLIPSPGLDVRVRYMPGTWLLWVALTLIIVGGIRFGFGKRPTFILIQIREWSKERSIAIVQSNQKVEVDLVERLLVDSGE